MPQRPARLRHALIAVGAALASAALAACGQAGDEEVVDASGNVNLAVSDEEGVHGGSLRYGLNAETDGWNPAASRWAPSGLIVAKSIFDTLAAYDEDIGWQPFLAEDFVPNDDHDVWRIVLRPGVTFHNGDPVDADAVAGSLNFLKDSPLTHQPFEPIESIEATGELEVTVTMVDRWVNFPYAMTTQIGVVAHMDWLTGEADDPIGTGPFEFVEWEPGNRLIVHRNGDYWNEPYPYLDEVVFQPIADESSRARALQTGDLDVMLTANARQIANARERAEQGEVQLVSNPDNEPSQVFAMLNTKAPPFDDPTARLAVAHATDQDSLIAALGHGEFDPARGPFPETSTWYTESDYPEFDQQRAAELADEVRAEHGDFHVTLFGVPGAASMEVAQILREQWMSVGIDVTIETLDQAQLIARVITGDYEATMWNQFDSPHPLGDSIWWHPEAAAEIPEFALNMARNENEQIGEHLDAAREAESREEEQELYFEVQRLMNEDVPYVWLYHSRYSIVARPHVVNVVDYELPNGTKGIELHGGAHPLWQIWLDRDR